MYRYGYNLTLFSISFIICTWVSTTLIDRPENIPLHLLPSQTLVQQLDCHRRKPLTQMKIIDNLHATFQIRGSPDCFCLAESLIIIWWYLITFFSVLLVYIYFKAFHTKHHFKICWETGKYQNHLLQKPKW